jgi:hypothetical protein
MKTLLLTRDKWDICLDASGNLAIAEAPYQVAQDVASAIRLFKGELWFDTAPGVPYWEGILGQQTTMQYVKAQFISAAQRVPTVVAAQCFLDSLDGRALSGQVQVITQDGARLIAGFGAAAGVGVI